MGYREQHKNIVMGQMKERFMDMDEARNYFNKSFGFDVRLQMAKDHKNGFYCIHKARERFEEERIKDSFPFCLEYDWEALMSWVNATSPFECSEKGGFLNLEWEKNCYQLEMADLRETYPVKGITVN